MKNLVISLLRVVSKICGNRFIQKILEGIVLSCQFIMGIGSVGEVSKSGEKSIFVLLKKRVKEPYCIFDVGANKGQFLNLAVDLLKDNNFAIHSFEPGKETFKILKDRNKQPNIFLNNIGLGKNNEDLTLYYDEKGSGLASLTKRRLDHAGNDFNQSEIVKIKTLDTYCKENDIKYISLLKIDVEGHELDVLAGAKKMFNNNSIDMVSFEFGGCNIDTRTFFQDFWYFFTERNMNIYRITPSGYLYPINSYKERYEQFRQTNYIAIKNT